MYRVLLIEDNPADVELTRIAFEDSGLPVRLQVAGSFREAGHLLETTAARPDLIMLDLNLGDGSGHELLSRIRRRPALRGVPVVIVTTSDYPQDRARAASLGATDYVVKPSSYDGFVDILRGFAPLLALSP